MKYLLKLSIVVLAAWLFIPMSGMAAGFKDVSTDYTFYDEVLYLSGEQIITGFNDGTFRPNNTVTRVQAAIMIARALGLENQDQAKFTDVDNRVTGAKYIAAAEEAGIIKGYSDGTFRPYYTVTRGQMAIFLDRAFTMTDGKTNPFKDVGKKMAAYQSILNVAESGVAGGYSDGTYRPNDPVTRGQFSAFMARALEPAFKVLPTATVKFLAVSQGTATYIEYPNGKNALIDAGASAAAIDAALRAEKINKIDTFIATHPDPEHIGGAVHVIQNYGVTKVIDNGKTTADKVYTDYLAAIIASGAARETAAIKDNLSDDAAVRADVLFTNGNAAELNDGAMAIMLTYGNNKLLLAGDVSAAVLDDLVLQGDINADILHISYDGANTALSKDFINIVSPSEAVFAYGKSTASPYESEVMTDLLLAGTSIYSTAEQNTITMKMNRNEYFANKPFWFAADHPVTIVAEDKLTAEQKQHLTVWLEERKAEEYGKTTDFIYKLDDQLYVISRGWQPNPGYGLAVAKVEARSEPVKIFIEIKKPDPGAILPQVTHYPILIAKINLPANVPVQFIASDTGEILN